MAAIFASLPGTASRRRMTPNRVRSMFSQPRLRAVSNCRWDVTRPGSAQATPDDAPFALQATLHRPGHGIEPVEYILRVRPVHIGVDPFAPPKVPRSISSATQP